MFASLVTGVLISACERTADKPAYTALSQPGGFNSEEERLFQEAEALKYAIDRLDQQQEVSATPDVSAQQAGGQQ